MASVGMTPPIVPASFAILATPAVTEVIAATAAADSGAPARVSLVLVRHFALTPRVVRLMHYGITAAIAAVAVSALTASLLDLSATSFPPMPTPWDLLEREFILAAHLPLTFMLLSVRVVGQL